MLPEGRWAHVCAIRQIITLQQLREMLLEPGDHLRNLLAWGSGDDEVPHDRRPIVISRISDSPH
jgi:hypothetical protein